MTEVLGDFIRALRAADVRVSTSESIDAGNVVDLVGFGSREVLRDGLSHVLAKSEDEKQAFRETFDKFFAFDQFKSREQGEAEERDEESDGEGEEGGDPSGQQGQSGYQDDERESRRRAAYAQADEAESLGFFEAITSVGGAS